MWLDRVSNPGPLALESDALPTALCGPTKEINTKYFSYMDRFRIVLITLVECNIC